MRRQPPLDKRQEAEFRRLLNENWIARQSMPRRITMWCLMSVTWPSAAVVPIAALAGWNWWLTWLATASASACLYAFSVFWPEQAADHGARQLMSEAEEQRLRDLPAPHPGRNLG